MNRTMVQKNQRLAIVTGGNRGIGREIARQLAVKGLQVLITCRDDEKGRQAVEGMQKEGLSVMYQVVDVKDSQSIGQMIKSVENNFGRLDVLVNNAGIILDRGVSVLDVEESAIRETFETNFYGSLRMIQASVPLMKRNQYGRIVNISSGLGAFDILQGFLGLKGSSSAYRISKTMLNALTCLVAQEVEKDGIRVNAVCPGRVQTDMGGVDAPLTVVEGADTAVWLATLGEDAPNGGFFRDRQQITW
ncbi:SDR family oxidoreductase [Brevibacillus fortis]|uniref:Short-chain dehydrogenase n=1 Tax=Brevibacillus fortis TaxID=2126352 RepID=A0A2P7UID6_9BACL|nr:SDR family oxidoreductase [Brevibacillus fortis]PSJ86766.1 short-chain dehydrogenase [Brevibacillus fortis]